MNSVARSPKLFNFQTGWFLPFVMSTILASLDASAAGFDCLIEPFQVIEIASPATGLLGRNLRGAAEGRCP